MKISTRGKFLQVSGADVSPHDPALSNMLSSRYYKNKGFFTFAASPLVAHRIQDYCLKVGLKFEATDDVKRLLRQYTDIQSAAIWKDEAKAKILLKSSSPFLTSTVPWDHQKIAYEFIKDMPSAYLAMDMGTGKTLVVINEILVKKPQWTLIVCPKAVIDVWEDEFLIHAPNHGFNVVLLNKGNTAKKAEYLATQITLSKARGQGLICVVNYESFWRGALGNLIKSGRWTYTVMDEIHKIKSASGRASKFASQITSHWKRGLSGTPLPNNKMDAFGQYRFLDPGFFGNSIVRFRNRFAIMGGYGGYEILKWKNEDIYNELLNKIMFRVDQSVLNLPADSTFWRAIEIPREARSMLSKLSKEFIVWLNSGEAVTAANALSKLMRMRQVTSGFVKDEDGQIHKLHDGRITALKDLFDEIGTNKAPFVVSAEFTYDLQQIRDLCSTMGLRYGEVSGNANDTVKNRIPPHIDVLGVQPKSGSLGLNMTASHYCIFYSIGFFLAEYLQMKKRVLRGGQTLETRFIHLVAPKTVDVEVYKALKYKKHVIDSIMDYVKSGGTI